MDLKNILEEWAADSAIDRNNLDETSRIQFSCISLVDESYSQKNSFSQW